MLFLVAFIGFSYGSYAQNPEVPKPAAPTAKEVAVVADQQVAILKAQRALQGTQIQSTDRRQKAIEAEQKMEQQDEANIKQAVNELNAAVDRARKEMKIDPSVPFDQMKLAFILPAAK